MLIEGNYEEIKRNTLRFVNEKLSEEAGSGEIVLSVGIFLSFTELTEEQKEIILLETVDICEGVALQKQINVEEYSASDELMSFISPY